MRKADFVIALVTVPNLAVGRKLAGLILQQRLAACVNILPHLESHYWWQGKLERGRECQLLIKTRHSRLRTLEHCVLQIHPYDSPEFIVLEITSGNRKYLGWLKDMTEGANAVTRK